MSRRCAPEPAFGARLAGILAKRKNTVKIERLPVLKESPVVPRLTHPVFRPVQAAQPVPSVPRGSTKNVNATFAVFGTGTACNRR